MMIKIKNLIWIMALVFATTQLCTAAEPRVLKTTIYDLTEPKDELFEKLIPYNELPKNFQTKIDKYKAIYLSNDYNRTRAVKVKRMAILPGGTISAFMLYMETDDVNGNCGIITMDIRRSGNYEYSICKC